MGSGEIRFAEKTNRDNVNFSWQGNCQPWALSQVVVLKEFEAPPDRVSPAGPCRLHDSGARARLEFYFAGNCAETYYLAENVVHKRP